MGKALTRDAQRHRKLIHLHHVKQGIEDLPLISGAHNRSIG
jgi:hypothetical protein